MNVVNSSCYPIYGLLHSPDYRSRYADNLGNELPRIITVSLETMKIVDGLPKLDI